MASVTLAWYIATFKAPEAILGTFVPMVVKLEGAANVLIRSQIAHLLLEW